MFMVILFFGAGEPWGQIREEKINYFIFYWWRDSTHYFCVVEDKQITCDKSIKELHGGLMAAS